MSNPTDTLIDQMPEPSSFADQIEPPSTGEVESPVVNGINPPVTPVESPSPLEWDSGAEDFAEPSETPVTGEVFNPDIHCVDENGNPRVTKSGKYRRKPGRKNAVNYAATDPNQINQAKMMNAQAAAQVSVAATFIAGQLCFGPEGAPQEGEPEQMAQSFTQFFYLSEKPVNIPPWVLVAMVIGSYAAKRMAMEQPRTRVMKGVAWIKESVYGIYKWIIGE
jgi:hypothetical protein